MSQLKMYRVTRKSFINGHLLEEGGGDNDDSAKLAALQQQYEEIFGVKPHHNAGVAKLTADIETKRKELGIN
ncbi:TPA: hypothetical protein ACSQ41_003053 [Serratia marcescens]